MFKPWLLIPPKLAHDLSQLAVQIYSQFGNKSTPEWSAFSWQGLEFKNRLGLAGGVDKNGNNLLSWQKLGCGFIEMGTVVPLPQEPNPGKIFDRSIEDEALWNKMGFPSHGAEEAFYNLRNFKTESQIPVFVNIGKNRKTLNEFAANDYVYLIDKFNDLADAFVVNISSPNTKGLRDLASRESLEAFLKPISRVKAELQSQKPIILKLSPDMESDDFKRIIDISVQNEIDGFVLTNTTLSRATSKTFSNEGGLSGKPVAELSKIALKTAYTHLGSEKSKKLLISVGGVMTTEDVFERLSLGADLVEVYTALVFSGLNFFRKVEDAAHELKSSQSL
jgi:dihydroorotate dehydrogenase